MSYTNRGARDTQKSKLYKAERILRTSKSQERLETVPEIQRWVNEIMRSQWWFSYSCPPMEAPEPEKGTSEWFSWSRGTAKASRHTYIEVKDGAGCSNAYGSNRGFIKLPRWSRYRQTILHELAHVIQKEFPGHGRQFARIYIDLVERWIGKDEAKVLRVSFKNHKVRFVAKRKGSPMSPKAREALAKWTKRKVDSVVPA